MLTIKYCDFCGETIPEGDAIHLGDIVSQPEALLDACAGCYALLWKMITAKALPRLAPQIESEPQPQEPRKCGACGGAGLVTGA